MADAAGRNTADVPPNQTLFCCNLNTKIHLTDLKSCLLEFFCPYGQILDIVASKSDSKQRGNAFVVFADISAATTALRSVHGREFLGRPIILSYAKSKSDKVAKLDGTFKIRRKRIGPAQVSVMEEDEEPTEAATASAPSVLKCPAGATVFVENLPSIMNEGALAILFNQYPGYIEARLVPGRCIAFVDFNNEMQAEMAMHGLNGFLVTSDAALKISLAKK